jgi:hypothetical protein
MIAKELIPMLAEILGIPPKTAVVIDRSLADSGFRRKHKGPNPPHMTRVEALHFMLGCMLALDTPTKAGDALKEWDECYGWLVSGYYDGDLDLEAFHSYGAEPPEDMVEKLAGKVEISNYEMKQVLKGIDGESILSGLGLVDILLRATRWAQGNEWDEISLNNFRFEVVRSHKWAFMDFRETNGQTSNDSYPDGRIRFQASADMDEIIGSETQMNSSRSVFGGTLAAIAQHTVDPLVGDVS